MTAILPEIEFITFDKGRNAPGVVAPARRAARAALRPAARHAVVVSREPGQPPDRRARSSSASIGERARELQWCSPTRSIEPAASEHVLDSFMGFARACGIEPGAPLWDI